MSENRAEQVEALQALLDYNPRLVHGMQAVTTELEGERKPDTDEFLKSVINGINWEIQIVNGTKEVLEEQEIRVDKDEINGYLKDFSAAYSRRDDYGMAVLFFQKIIPFFETLEKAARNVVENA